MQPSIRRVLLAGLAAFVLVCLFPAWKATADATTNESSMHLEELYGFRFIATPPAMPDPRWAVKVDTSRTALAILAVWGLTGIGALMLRRGVDVNTRIRTARVVELS